MRTEFTILMVLAALSAACAAPPASAGTTTLTPTSSPVSTGVLEGLVYLIGTPCPPDMANRSIPCDGPYSDYGVKVHDAETDAVVRMVMTNGQGFYHAELPPGVYRIYTPNGPFPLSVETNAAIVRAHETTVLDLVVDTGIR